MTVQRLVLDANIVSAILKKNPLAGQRFASALRENAAFLLCPIVYYEVRRGLIHRDATKQLTSFEQLILPFQKENLTLDDWRASAAVWADLRSQGMPIGDADIVIGVFAQRRNAVVITDNVRHFDQMGIVSHINWLRDVE